MSKKKLNKNLHKAKKVKNDEFYTIIEDIAKEIVYYVPLLKNKIIFCNCDNENSNFWKFFMYNFNHLQLKKLIATSYNSKEISYKLEYDGKNVVKTPLQQNGDFRSPECIDLLKESDVVITNPPFSLFREYMAQLIEHKKQFLIIGNQNATTYKNIFSLIKENKIWLGYNVGAFRFKVPSTYNTGNTEVDKLGNKYVKMGNIAWYTNLDVITRHEELILYKKYNPKKYPTYDNYKAININKIEDIPKDYFEIMGVPITFLDKYNSNQFEILGDSRYHDGQDFADDINVIKGKTLYRRILIKRRV